MGIYDNDEEINDVNEEGTYGYRSAQYEDDVPKEIESDESKYLPDSEAGLFGPFVFVESNTSRNKIVSNKDGVMKVTEIPTKYIERLTTDLSTANLDTMTKEYIREFFEICALIQDYGERNNIDMSTSHNLFARIMFGEAVISKGFGFTLLKELKSNRSESMTKSEHINKEPPKEKKGWFGF